MDNFIIKETSINTLNFYILIMKQYNMDFGVTKSPGNPKIMSIQ